MEVSMMLLKAYRTINALSLDVAVGACISALFIASFLQVSLSIATVLSLGTSVWLIYTVDHLMDARQIDHEPHTFRHGFHQKYFKIILKAVGLVTLIQLILLFFLPLKTLIWGASLLFIVFLYFLMLWSLKSYKVYHKEVMIALVYTCGIFLPALSIANKEVSLHFGLLFSQLTMLALTNLLIFSLLETASDRKDQQASLALMLGAFTTKRIIIFLLGLGAIIAIGGFFAMENAYFDMAQVVIFLMNFILGLILILPSLQQHDRYRMIGDAIFYIPIIFVLWVP